MTTILPDDLRPGTAIGGLAGATGLDGEALAFGVVDGRVAGAAADGSADGVQVDATGWVALPPPADLHAHLDKAYTWTAAGRPEGSLEDAVGAWSAYSGRHDAAAIAANARRQLVAALGAGVTAIRTHVNLHEGADPLRGIREVVALREELRGLVDVQVVAMLGHPAPDGAMRDALALGADLVGGAPHLTDDPVHELDRLIALAEEAGVGVDLHTDERLDPASRGLLDLADRTAAWPAGMTRSAGHCVSLAMQPVDRLTATLDAVAAADVSIVVNPLTNLFLQGRHLPVATPRAIPPVAAILDAGVVLAAGGDNVQDPFLPLGSGDMIDVVAALVLAGHLTPARAWAVAAHGGRRVLGLPPAGGAPGDAADLLLVRAAHVADAIAERAPDRVVLRGGRVTAVRRTSTETLLPDGRSRA